MREKFTVHKEIELLQIIEVFCYQSDKKKGENKVSITILIRFYTYDKIKSPNKYYELWNAINIQYKESPIGAKTFWN
jgi:hypothetical protein